MKHFSLCVRLQRNSPEVIRGSLQNTQTVNGEVGLLSEPVLV